MILWSASLLLSAFARGDSRSRRSKKRVKRKGNYQMCENITLVCLRLCTRRQQVEASVAGEAAERLVLSNTPLNLGGRLLVLIILHIAILVAARLVL